MDLNVNIIIQRLFKNNNKDKVGKMVEEWVEATLTSSQDQSGITTKMWRNHLEQTTEQYWERENL